MQGIVFCLIRPAGGQAAFVSSGPVPAAVAAGIPGLLVPGSQEPVRGTAGGRPVYLEVLQPSGTVIGTVSETDSWLVPDVPFSGLVPADEGSPLSVDLAVLLSHCSPPVPGSGDPPAEAGAPASSEYSVLAYSCTHHFDYIKVMLSSPLDPRLDGYLVDFYSREMLVGDELFMMDGGLRVYCKKLSTYTMDPATDTAGIFSQGGRDTEYLIGIVSRGDFMIPDDRALEKEYYSVISDVWETETAPETRASEWRDAPAGTARMPADAIDDWKVIGPGVSVSYRRRNPCDLFLAVSDGSGLEGVVSPGMPEDLADGLLDIIDDSEPGSRVTASGGGFRVFLEKTPVDDGGWVAFGTCSDGEFLVPSDRDLESGSRYYGGRIGTLLRGEPVPRYVLMDDPAPRDGEGGGQQQAEDNPWTYVRTGARRRRRGLFGIFRSASEEK